MAISPIKAFLSCSLRPEDELIVNAVAKICRHYGFIPMLTVGKYEAAPMPIYQQMVNGIKKCDCVVLIATPRYQQQDIHSRKSCGHGISEMLHVETGMAALEGKPVLAFVQKGTNVGSFIPGLVQYIEIELAQNGQISADFQLVHSYFCNALHIVNANRKMAGNKELVSAGKALLTGIGAITVLSALFSGGDPEYEEES